MRHLFLIAIIGFCCATAYAQVSGAYSDNNNSFVFRAESPGLVKVKSFLAGKGVEPAGDLKLGPDGYVYGMLLGRFDFTFLGLSIFRCLPDGSNYSVVYTIENDDPHIYDFDILPDGSVYWIDNYASTINRIGAGGQTSKVFYDLRWDGVLHPYPQCLLAASNGFIYGTTSHLGDYGEGYIYKIRPDGSDFSIIQHFDGNSGRGVRSRLRELDGRIIGTSYWSLPGGNIFEIDLENDRYQVLFSFDDFNKKTGKFPKDGVIFVNGKFYGLAEEGGANDMGVVYNGGCI